MINQTTPEIFPPPGFVPGPSKLNGIEVYVPHDPDEKRPELIDFKCPQCGATIAYSVTAAGLVCEYCGFSETPEVQQLGRAAEKFEFKIETVQRSQQNLGEERKELAWPRRMVVVWEGRTLRPQRARVEMSPAPAKKDPEAAGSFFYCTRASFRFRRIGPPIRRLTMRIGIGNAAAATPGGWRAVVWVYLEPEISH